MISKIEELRQQIKSLQAANEQELEALRIKFLSKKGEIAALMNDFRSVPADMKREVGMKINALKQEATDHINQLRASLATKEDDSLDTLDLTRTPYPAELGTRHPLTIVRNRIIDIFSRMGFTLADGPEVEDDWHVYGPETGAADVCTRAVRCRHGDSPAPLLLPVHGAQRRDGRKLSAMSRRGLLDV